MRILVGTGLNQGSAEYQNIGDIAMLQVTVSRLAELWPEAEILVLTDSEKGLARFCPQAKPLSRVGAQTWLVDGVITGPLHVWLPAWITKHIRRSKRWLRAHAPGVIDVLLRGRFSLHDGEARGPKVESFVRAIRSCDLLVLAGSGGFADSCRDWNLYALGLIEVALALHKQVALFGQGIGPIADAEILDRMREILSRVSLLASRGSRGADAIAAELNVPKAVFITTGDDAIEPAYRARAKSLGSGIGVNLRVASYSGVSDADADEVGAVLRDFAVGHGAELVPMPIALHGVADDRKSIEQILGVPIASMPMLDSPEAIYAQTAKCRLVVTGAYHAAVFALAQGVPAICICGSDYYAAKFEGLRCLFGEGCMVVNLQESNSLATLSNCCSDIWRQADQRRADLQIQACEQIEASRKAYRMVHLLLATGQRSNAADPAVLSIP